jgi:hypothetical protein
MKKKIQYILLALLLLHLLLLINTSFVGWPEMLAWPYFIIKGWLPYKDIAIAHTPLLILDMAIFYKIFGVGVLQLKIYSWLLIILIDGAVYYIAKALWGRKAAIVSLLFYIPLQFFYEGNGIWFDYALTFFGLMLFYSLLTKKYGWAGIFWALGFFTKQTAAWFLFPAGLLLLGVPFSKIKKSFLGAVGTMALGLALLWAIGILPDFIYWALKFGIGVLPHASGQINLPATMQLVTTFLPFSIVIIALLSDWKRYLVLSLWAVFGIMGAFPRWELFHFQPGLPFLAMAAAIFFLERQRAKRWIMALGVLYFVGFALMFMVSVAKIWHRPDRFIDPSAIKVAEYIKQVTKPDERIFVLNSWDNLYALSDRLPATKPWLPQLKWYVDLPGVEEKMVNNLKSSPPTLIVMQPYTSSGLSSFIPREITDYLFKYYQTTHMIDNTFSILIPNK